MINWGILGFGRMGLSFSKVIKETSNSKLISIGSKSQNKSENIKDYDDVIKNKNIDAIYIATLNNSHHKDLILQILKSDKNILCEKPICTNLEQALKINQNKISSNTKFIEAIAYYSHPQTLRLLMYLSTMILEKLYKSIAVLDINQKKT